jgi:hypothetical protein
MDENMLRFMVAQNCCAELTIFHRRGLPSSILSTESPTFRNTISYRPILIDREVSAVAGPEQSTPGLELVPWKPCFLVALLQLWPIITSILMRKCAAQEAAASEPSMEAPTPSSPMVCVQLSPRSSKGRRKRTTKSSAISLPKAASSLAMAVVDGSVRRCTLLNKSNGFYLVQLEREPARKRKINIVRIDEETGRHGPVPLAVLQGWGIDCGVPPSELTVDGLLQEPAANQVFINEEDQNI